MTRLRHEGAALLLAVQFLTRLRLPAGIEFTPARQAGSVRHYPLVGVFIGALGAGLFVVLSAVFGAPLSVLLTLAGVVCLTGALHEDGLADTFDALGGAVPRERALVIMRDSRIGTYGVVALLLVTSVKLLALLALPPAWIPWLLVAGHATSRTAVVSVMACSRYVREDGAASELAGRQPRSGLAFAGATAMCALAVVPLLMDTPPPAAAILGAMIGLGLGAGLTWRWFQRRLGGYTGDCLGAVQQLSETGLYLGVAALY